MEQENLKTALGTAESTIGSLSPTTISEDQRQKLSGINETLGSISELLKKTDTKKKTPSLSEYFQPDYSEDKGYKTAQSNLYKLATGADVVDTNAIRSQKISEVQDRINALNQIYAQQLADVKKEGVGRVGSGTAILASRGLAGTGRGGAIQEDILKQNRELEGAVRAEQSLKIQQILDEASDRAVKEAQSRREAIASGAQAYIDFIKGQDERKNNNVSTLAANLIANGVDIAELSDIDVVAKQLGVSPQTIIGKYNELKKIKDAEDAQAVADAEKRAREGRFTLSEGQAEYDQYGNLIASRPKTYAPKEGGSEILSITEAKTLGVPYGTTRLEAQLMGKTPGIVDQTSAIKTDAITSAKALLEKFNKGIGTSAVGGSRVFGLQNVPGTAPRDFQVQFDNLKSLLSLDNIKLLKGQGAVSDAERKLLADASSKLDLSQSEKEFKKALEDIVKGLSGTQTPNDVSSDPYAEYRSQVRVGEVLVNRNGSIYAVPEEELLSTDIQL